MKVRRLNVEISPFKTLSRASGGFCHLPGFPGGASDKEHAQQHRRSKRLGLSPWVRKIPWRKECQRTPLSLPGEPYEQRRLTGYSL